MTFTGFPKGFFKFFEDLTQNNNREWFTDNKPRYEAGRADFVGRVSSVYQDATPMMKFLCKAVDTPF